MECKWTHGGKWHEFNQELIDTLWNVNETGAITATNILMELIDTLWNVNAESPKEGTIVNGINRYIMECK